MTPRHGCWALMVFMFGKLFYLENSLVDGRSKRFFVAGKLFGIFIK